MPFDSLPAEDDRPERPADLVGLAWTLARATDLCDSVPGLMHSAPQRTVPVRVVVPAG